MRISVLFGLNASMVEGKYEEDDLWFTLLLFGIQLEK